MGGTGRRIAPAAGPNERLTGQAVDDRSAQRIRATPRGWDLLNAAIELFLPES
jgi:hypothetical protein